MLLSQESKIIHSIENIYLGGISVIHATIQQAPWMDRVLDIILFAAIGKGVSIAVEKISEKISKKPEGKQA